MTTFEIGSTFENWCLDNLFTISDKEGFTLLNIPSVCNHKVKSNEKPDFEIFCNKYQIRFFVECKYISDTDYFFNREMIEMRYFQNKNHYTTSKEAPIFYLFGVGGKPNEPKYLYLPPFKVIKKNTFIDSIRDFSIKKGKYKNFLELFNCETNN